MDGMVNKDYVQNIYKNKKVLITGHTGLKVVGCQYGYLCLMQRYMVFL